MRAWGKYRRIALTTSPVLTTLDGWGSALSSAWWLSLF